METSKNALRLGAVSCFALAIALAVRLLLSESALLDWDTYQRVQFIRQYDPNRSDTHVLYHIALLGLLQLGLSPINAIFNITAGSVGLLAAVAWWVTGDRGLRGRARLLMVGVLLCASPGFVALVLMAEDNVSYLPFLLCFLHLITSDQAALPMERIKGFVAGIALAVALLINTTALIFLVIVPLSVFAWSRNRPVELNRVGFACLALFSSYYGFIVLTGWGEQAALHRYLWQAIALQDFGADPAPIFSWRRVEGFFLGARAMFLAPTSYRMALPSKFSSLFLYYVPLLLLILQAALSAMTVYFEVNEPRDKSCWRILPLTMVAVTLAFPYFYESLSIERWDMFWLCHFLWLTSLIRSHPRKGIEVLASVLILLGVLGTSLVLAHHFRDQFAQQGELELRTTIEQIREEDRSLALFSADIDRHHLAHLAHHMPNGSIYLLDDFLVDSVECIRVSRILVETRFSCQRLGERIHLLGGAFTHVDVSSTSIDHLNSYTEKP